jgi:hypothetical protein
MVAAEDEEGLMRVFVMDPALALSPSHWRQTSLKDLGFLLTSGREEGDRREALELKARYHRLFEFHSGEIWK